MKTVIAALAALCLSSVTALAGTTEQALIGIENNWAKAYVKKDVAAIGTYLADDWVAQSDGADRYSKKVFLADVKSGKLAFTAITLRDMKVRVVGNVGIVQGYDDETSSYDRQDTSGAYSWIDVFENRGGKWVAIASQVTMLKK